MSATEKMSCWIMTFAPLVCVVIVLSCQGSGSTGVAVDPFKNTMEDFNQKAEELKNEMNNLKLQVDTSAVVDSIAKFQDALVKVETRLTSKIASDDNQAGRDVVTNPVTYVDAIQAIWPPLLLFMYLFVKRFPLFRALMDKVQGKKHWCPGYEHPLEGGDA